MRTYERLRVLLSDELGLDPSPPLQRMQEQVLLHASDNVSWAAITDEGVGYDPALTGVLVVAAGLAAAVVASRRLPAGSPEKGVDPGRPLAARTNG